MVNRVFVNSVKLFITHFCLNMVMDEKKKNEMDDQVEAENSDVSCSSCPFDVMTQKILGIFRRK